MRDTLRQLILDFQELPMETGTPRRTRMEPTPGKAAVCIGVRRCGKSTYLFQIMERLYREGVRREDILYVNFFDDRLRNLNADTLALIPEAYYSIYPEKKGAETVYCFFDEIQAVPGWEAFVDRILRTERCEVYLTGSSARMLSKEIATQMRGRAISWEMFPFSFGEFLQHRGVPAKGAMSTRSQLLVQKAFEEYWETGGFPEVPDVIPNLRVRIHQEYLTAILFRDLIERHNISHPRALTDLAHRLLDNTASLYSVNSLTGYLKSLGHKVPKSSVSDYIEWFEDAYFLFTVRIFDASLARSNTNPKKMYCIDHALVKSVSSGILVNDGHLLENLVFLALRRRFPAIFYYKTRTGREVDFVVPVRGGRPLLIQVCETLGEEKTRKREVGALETAMQENSVTKGTIVTRSETDRFDVAGGTIEVWPAWRFLLKMSEPVDSR